MLFQRVLSAILLAPVFLYCVYRGGPWFFTLMALLSFQSMVEFHDLMAQAGKRCQRVLGYLWIAALYLGLAWGRTEGLLAAVALVPPLFLLKYLGTPAIDGAAFECAHTFYGVVAYGLPLAFLVPLRDFGPLGAEPLVLLVVLVWMQDTAAYFWGRAIGKHLFQQHISPKKTWEGAILGLLTALAATWACAVYVFGRPLSGPALAGLVVTAVAAQLGDLNESLLKRNVGAKDSGTLIPGHGGVLDRFDSFTFAAPVMYYVALWTF
jgi:phosphatidate cytidylyltransferase